MNPLGQKLLAGRYQVLEKLGQGGMGEVYKGQDTQTQAFVAIKQLRGSISSDTTVIERFRREGQALSDLNHPNIVKIWDMIQQDNEYFLVTEYLDGGDLANLLRQVGKLPLNEALKIGLELADALSRAHHLGIIHRDIKPANVLMAADGSPRLTDFGVAHIASQERLTGTGMAVGTMDYLPPEAVNGEAVDVRADIWSFGVMLYEMLTGTRPFQGTTTMQLLSNILAYDAPDIRAHVPEASPELNELIQQMLQKDRNQRIRSVRQVGAALEAIIEGDTNVLQRLQTPSKTSTLDNRLPDLPTTPGIPLKVTESPISSSQKRGRWGRRWRRIREKRGQNQLARMSLVIAIVAIMGLAVTLALGGSLPSFASTTSTPMPTVAPILGDAPSGYRWASLDELAFLVPAAAVSVPTETIVGMQGGLADGAVFEDLLAQQRSYASYVNWIKISGMAVMIEDSPVVLPDEVLLERFTALAQDGGSAPLEDSAFLELPFGHTLFIRDVIPALVADGVDSRMEAYAIQSGSQIYVFAFLGKDSDFAGRKSEIETILASVHLQEAAEATLEASNGLPNGFHSVNLDELTFALPPNWVKVPDTIIETFIDERKTNSGVRALVNIFNQQRAWAIYIDWTNFEALLVTIEDVPIPLPDEAYQERAEALASAGDTLPIEAMEFLDLPFGRTFFVRNDVPAEDDTEAGRMEMYSFSRGTTVYTLSFNAAISDFEAEQELFNTILGTVEVGANVEVTPEATAIALPNLPEGWQIAQGEQTAYAVPENFIITKGTNRVLLNAATALILGNQVEGDSFAQLFEQINIDVFAGNLGGSDLFFASSIYQESPLGSDLTVAGGLVEGIFTTLADNSNFEFTVLSSEAVEIPSGAALRSDLRVTVPERPALRSVYYLVLSDDGRKLYGLAFSFLDSEADRMLPLIEQIVQTFVILD